MKKAKDELTLSEISAGAAFRRGLKDGIPIGLGYFVVSVSLGITARDCGFNALQGFVASILTYASAGQYIGFTLFAVNATLIELIILTIITNARYILMGLALNQRLPDGIPLRRRLLAGAAITDEIFGISIAQQGDLNPMYPFGALVCAAPMWASGMAVGITLGNVLPARIVSALGVALFGMFLAAIIPACRKDRIVAIVVVISFAASYGLKYLPILNTLSTGNRTILLTLVISAAAALIVPVKPGRDRTDEAADDIAENDGDL